MVAASADTPGLSGRTGDLFPFWVGMAALLVAFAIGFSQTIRWILSEWSGSGGVLSHGYLVGAISVYLVARAAPGAAELPRAPMWLALPVLLALSFVWLLGHAATVIAVETVLLPAMLLAAIATAFGLQVARRFAFPILFLYFAIPAVEHLQFVFQEITVVAVHLMIRAVDISAFVERNVVYVPAGTFAIESGCSGLNFVVSGLSLATLYGHLYYRRRRDTLRLAVLVLVISMIGNWIRVFAIVTIGYHFGMDSSIVADHLWLGWVIFAILMVPMFIVARRWESVAPGAEAEKKASSPSPGPHPVSIPATAAAVLALSVGPAWAGTAAPGEREFQTVEIRLPEDISGWRGPDPTVWNWQPSYIGATSERIAEYARGERVVLVYANVYLSQEQGRELIFFSNKVTGNWRRSRTAAVPANVHVPDAGRFELTVAESVYGPWVIVYRNVIGGEPVIGELQSKLRQSVATLRGRPEAGVVAFASPCAGSCDEAMAALSDFITAAGDDATVNFEIED